MSDWHTDLGKVTHPAAFAAFAVDIGPIHIVVDGSPRKLIGASFRGVSFFVEMSDLEGGRRAVNHEYPFQSKNYVDDMGVRAAVYKLDGYVIGKTYLDTKKSLIDALRDKDEKGPGTLLHPYYGSILATCPKFSCREKRDEGGMAVFSIEFWETPQDPPFPSISISLDSLLGAILGAIAAVIAAIALVALAIIVTALTLAALVKAVESFVDAIEDACLGLVSLFDPQEGAVFLQDIEEIRLNVLVLARRPGDLIAAFDNAFGKITGADPLGMTDALLTVFSTPLGPAPIRQTAYYTAVVSAIQRWALLRACRFASAATYDSAAQAIAVRSRISTLLDAVADDQNEDVYRQMVDVRSALVRTVPPADTAQVVSYTPTAGVPSILLAYQLYGSTDLELDVVTRNRAAIPHPGFVRGGRELEVRSGG